MVTEQIKGIILPVVCLILFITACNKEVFVEGKDDSKEYKAKLYVNSNPPNAKIYIDGKYSGFNTPDTIKYLDEKNISVTLKYDMLRDTSFNVSVSQSTLSTVYCNYYGAPWNFGSIECKTTPPGVEIYLNGVKRAEKTPAVLMNLFAKHYNVKYRNLQYRDDSLTVPVYGNTLSSAYVVMQDTSVWVDYIMKNSNIPGNNVIALKLDKNNVLWGGTLETGIFKFQNNKFTNYNPSNSGLISENITALEFDKNNILWVGTAGGLSSFDGTVWLSYTKSAGKLPNNYVTSLYCDINNVLWVGTQNGLVKVSNGQFTTYYTGNSGIVNNFIMGVTANSDGKLWVSTADGISSFFNNVWTNYTRSSHGLIGWITGPIVSDSKGNVWCEFALDDKAGISGGIMKFDGIGWRFVSYPSITNGKIYSIYIDNSNNMWLGAEDGLLLVKPNNTYTLFKSQQYYMWSYDVRSVVIDKNNVLWMGLMKGGIVKNKKR